MRSKKAVLEVQFNWIFVLVAGAIILVFFTGIIARQKTVSDNKGDLIVLRGLDSIITSTKVSRGTATSITLPRGDIYFDCDGYRIGAMTRQLKDMPVFSPNLIKGKQIVTWSYEWNVPFRATNFLYLTSPQVRYVFVYDGEDSFGHGVFEEITERLTLEDVNMNIEGYDTSVSPPPIEDKNNYKVKFIYFNTNPSSTNLNTNLAKYDVTAINVVPDSTDGWSSGTIQFYKKNNGQTTWGSAATSYFYQNATLFAAIFAEDMGTYECVILKELEKVHRVANILRARSQALMGVYGAGTTCYTVHDNAVTQFDLILPPDPAVAGVSELGELLNIESNLKTQNEQAEFNSCALIY